MTIEEFQQQHGIIGKSKEIRDLVDITMQVAPSDITVLVYGESGVGKEVFARAIHNYSRRANYNLVSVNCGAIPEGILESELFGHKKGAFTGAVEDRKGYFEIAHNGTLFLDEIAEMPLTTQVKLLRVLETKEFMRIGGEKYETADVRIIAATNKDLQKEVDAKRFRSDLYFRLKAVALYIPPLRNRREDIPILIDKFVREYAHKNKMNSPRITEDAVNLLYEYNWPGNIRELKNVIESAMALNREEDMDTSVFAPLIPHDDESFESKNLPIHLKRSPETLDREMLYRALIEIKKDIVELKELAYDTTHQFGQNQGWDAQEVIPLDKLERNAIINALNYTKGNKRKAAQLLNVSERTLYRKIKEYEI